MALGNDASTSETDAGRQSLARLKEREEILQICYWYQGEGFGDVFTPQAVMPFLASDPNLVVETFENLVQEGALVRHERGYAFATDGRRTAARMFVETFTDFQQPSHGECQDGCCDGDETCARDPVSGLCNDPRHRMSYVPSGSRS